MKIIDNEIHYTITEVGQLIGVTRATILRWYEYEEIQNDSYKHILPKYKRIGGNNTMYFSINDLPKFDIFRNNTKKGDMAKVSNKYNGTISNNASK